VRVLYCAAALVAATRVSAQLPHAAAACGWPVAQAGTAVDHRIVVTADTMLLLRKLVERKKYDEVERRFAFYDSAVRADVRNDDAWMAAYRSFHTNVPWLKLQLDDWVEARPASAHARVARAYHHVARATATAGRDYGFLGMDTTAGRGEHWTVLAIQDLAAVPKTSSAAVQALLVLGISGQGDSLGLRSLAAALEELPASSAIRQQYARSIRRRWGGSREALEAFALESQQYADREPRLRALLGYADWDEGSDLGDYSKDAAGEERMLAKALAYGDAADFRYDRAMRLARQQKWKLAIPEFDCATALAPWRMDALAYGAWARIRMGSQQRFSPEGHHALQTRGWRDLHVAMDLNLWNSTVWDAQKRAYPYVSMDIVDEHNGPVKATWYAIRALLGGMKGLGLFMLVSFANVLAWRRYRFFIPGYIHVMALIALASMIGVNYMWHVGGGYVSVKRIVNTVFFPFFVYFAFITYGGAKAAFEGRFKRGRA
jgi:hypothetical protein